MALPKLTKDYDYLSFDCGIESFNNYLKNAAFKDMGSRRQAQVYILPHGNNVIGFYTIEPFAFEPSELPVKLAKKRTANLKVSSWLIGRLARDLSVKGQGIGEKLLMDALQRIKRLSDEGGGYCVIVDTEFEKTDKQYKKLFDFYNSFGFELLDETRNSRRLFLPVTEIPVV
jgi:GNAT superfamily N-acetyltransferase